MPSLESSLGHLRSQLAELVQRHSAPGVTFAVGRGDEVFTAAAGLANLSTGAPVTTETKFLIGSNTKAMTITLFMRALDEGLVDLDEKVLTYLPDFKTASEETTSNVTVKNILLHNNGIGGDFAGGRFPPYRDFGRGDEALANLVAALPEAGIAHPIGLTWAYSNAAYVVAGRILEVIHGQSFSPLLRERLLDPLGMSETALTPEESILGSCAVGHQRIAADGGLKVTDHYLLPHALAPAGAIVNSTARDMVRFGRMFLDNGKSATGEQIISEPTLDLMLTPQFQVPQPLIEVYMCLSMIYEPRADHRRYRSSGSTTGQTSMMHILPDHDLVLVSLGNGPGAAKASTAMVDNAIRELTGLEPAGPPVVPEAPADLDLAPYEGTYESIGVVTTVKIVDGDLEFTHKGKDSPPDSPGQVAKMKPIGNHQFIYPSDPPAPGGVTFLEVEGAKAGFMWSHSVARRIA